MGKKTDIDAIEVVRRIRDRHAELLQGKSNEEIMEFFREAGEQFRRAPRTESPATANKRVEPSTSKSRRG